MADHTTIKKVAVLGAGNMGAGIAGQVANAGLPVLLLDVTREAAERGSPEHLAAWRKLSTSDHVYYMSTKWHSDGDVHEYFTPYDSPHDSFIFFMNVLDDLSACCGVSETDDWNDPSLAQRVAEKQSAS